MKQRTNKDKGKARRKGQMNDYESSLKIDSYQTFEQEKPKPVKSPRLKHDEAKD